MKEFNSNLQDKFLKLANDKGLEINTGNNHFHYFGQKVKRMNIQSLLKFL